MYTLSYWINRLSNGLNVLSRWLLIGAATLISCIVFLQVFFRFTFQIPFPWSEESARYLMIWMGMIGSAVAIRHARHIGVTILIERLPPSIQRALAPAAQAAMILLLCILAREGLRLAIGNWQQLSPAMRIPMFYPYLAIPVGAALMILELIAAMLQEFFPTEAGVQRRSTPATAL